MNYWDRHIGDIIRDTVSLTMLEDGAYTRLLDQYYQTERPLPLDRKMVYRLARAISSTERKAVDFVIETFFHEGPDGYHQKRCDAEIARFQDKQRKAQASANARWNRSDGNANASQTHDVNGMRTHCEGNAHQTPDTRHHKPSTNNQTPDTTKGLKAKAPAALELPEWLPEDAWTDFVDMRKKTKAPLTDKASRLAIAELEKLMQDGHRPRAVLEQSTLNSWRGLFAIKTPTARANGNHDSREAFNARENARAKELLFGPEMDNAA